jgi:hypothetical protein
MEGTTYVVSDGRIRTGKWNKMAREFGTEKEKVAAHGAVAVMKFCVSFRAVVKLVPLLSQ